MACRSIYRKLEKEKKNGKLVHIVKTKCRKYVFKLELDEREDAAL